MSYGIYFVRVWEKIDCIITELHYITISYKAQQLQWLNTDQTLNSKNKRIPISHLYGWVQLPCQYFDSAVQDCSHSSALALELLQSCTEPSISFLIYLSNNTTRLYVSLFFIFLHNTATHKRQPISHPYREIMGNLLHFSWYIKTPFYVSIFSRSMPSPKSLISTRFPSPLLTPLTCPPPPHAQHDNHGHAPLAAIDESWHPTHPTQRKQRLHPSENNVNP